VKQIPDALAKFNKELYETFMKKTGCHTDTVTLAKMVTIDNLSKHPLSGITLFHVEVSKETLSLKSEIAFDKMIFLGLGYKGVYLI
jgi:hypothetical protein